MALSRLLRLLPIVVLLCVPLLAGCGDSSEGSDEADESRTNVVVGAEREPAVKLPKDKSPEKLVVRDLREGIGVAARKGDALITKFVAKYTNGKRFESSWDKGEIPFVFELGAEQSNPGWEKGLPGMRVGGERELIVPSDMASRFGPLPEGSDLIYVVELIGVIPPQLLQRQEPKVSPRKGAAPENPRVRDLIKGKGGEARPGDLLTIEYVGVSDDGTKIDNTWQRRKVFRVELGADQWNPAWEDELGGMRVGGRREVIAPSGDVYVIDLIGITEPDDARR